MSLPAPTLTPIPEETVRVAQAAFPKGNLYLKIHDLLGTIYQDALFEGLFPRRGQPAQSPWRLALVTLLQFAQGLSDRQAAEAVRSRIDWKYGLALPLDDPGFDSSVRCEFRTRLVEGSQETLLLETWLTHLKDKQLLKARGRQRTDSTHVLAAVRTLNRLTCVGETRRRALQALEVIDPAWFQAWVPADFLTRYDRRFEDFRLPSERQARHELGETIGGDGWLVLETVLGDTAPAYLRQVPAVAVLRQVWIQQYVIDNPRLRWRTAEELPPGALLISTPYDVEARYSQKRDTTWTGYKVHGTETCDPDTPHLITQVKTTPATTSDIERLEPIHQDLKGKALLPDQHGGLYPEETIVPWIEILRDRKTPKIRVVVRGKARAGTRGTMEVTLENSSAVPVQFRALTLRVGGQRSVIIPFDKELRGQTRREETVEIERWFRKAGAESTVATATFGLTNGSSFEVEAEVSLSSIEMYQRDNLLEDLL
jgi:transposase